MHILCMKSVLCVLDANCISPFWAPNAIQYDLAFNDHEFKDFLSTFDMQTRPIPARRHNKNIFKSKHKIIREIFLRIKENSETVSDTIAAQQAIRIQTIYMVMEYALPTSSQKDILDQFNQEHFQKSSLKISEKLERF